MKTMTADKKAEVKLVANYQDLSDKTRTQAIGELLVTLATTVDLYTQTKQAHWNVKGPNFIALHELFDTIAGQVNEYSDEIAERITALGGIAYGTSRYAGSQSILPEYPLEETKGTKHVEALVERYGIYAKHLREKIDTLTSIGDAGTADLYTGLSRQIDKALWFIEAHLQ